MPLTLKYKEDCLRKFREKYPHVIQRPFSCRWRPEEVLSNGYIPIREHGSKYYLFKTRDAMIQAENLMEDNE